MLASQGRSEYPQPLYVERWIGNLAICRIFTVYTFFLPFLARTIKHLETIRVPHHTDHKYLHLAHYLPTYLPYLQLQYLPHQEPASPQIQQETTSADPLPYPAFPASPL